MDKIEYIDEIIGKFLSGNALPEEAIVLEDWKNQSKDNLNYFLSFEKTYHLLEMNPSDLAINEGAAWKIINGKIQRNAKHFPLRSKPNRFLQIAATLIFAAGIGLIINYFVNTNTHSESFYFAENNDKMVDLADGTEIHISKHSQLTVDKSFGIHNRTVRLIGNAKFEVKHQDSLPFIVDADGIFIKDIGTIFSIRNSADSDSVYIQVEEGVVLVFDNFGTELEIKAGQKTVYVRSSKQIMNASQVQNANTQLKFDEAKLEHVISILNDRFATEIVLESADLGNCVMTTSFGNEDLDTILGIITETLGLKFEKTKTGYLIKGQKCQF